MRQLKHDVDRIAEIPRGPDKQLAAHFLFANRKSRSSSTPQCPSVCRVRSVRLLFGKSPVTRYVSSWLILSQHLGVD